MKIEIKKRRSIRDQLERSTPLGVKFLLSIVVGSVVGSTSYLLKRRKLSSIVSGVAAGVSTFLFIKWNYDDLYSSKFKWLDSKRRNKKDFSPKSKRDSSTWRTNSWKDTKSVGYYTSLSKPWNISRSFTFSWGELMNIIGIFPLLCLSASS